MSNTLNTPIEALETEFPLRVANLSLRRGSGGAGVHSGGEGVVRELEALAPMRFTLITERRRHPPKGSNGAEDGAPGANLLNGEPLPGKADGELEPGDRLRLETPGGGGRKLETVYLVIRRRWSRMRAPSGGGAPFHGRIAPPPVDQRLAGTQYADRSQGMGCNGPRARGG